MEAGGVKDAARSAEEEAVKRNTDCVYFLASPLTCKKGAECDYRHSEAARVNPRDCWYWLNGSCLNPKCSFRHPPLDGLIGTPTAASLPALSAQPNMPLSAPSTYSTPNQNVSKQNVPCYYFLRGGCLKGERCPFSHGSAPLPNPVVQQATKVITPVNESLQTVRKSSWILDKGSQPNIPKVASLQSTEVVPSVKPSVQVTAPATNGLMQNENSPMNVDFFLRSETSVIPPDCGNAPSKSHSRKSESLDDDCENDREGDEHFRESSPGFDVLVHNENVEPGYFCEEDEFGGASGLDGRSVNPAADVDYHHSSDYDNAAKFMEPFGDCNEYGHHVRANDYYTQEHHGAFLEQALESESISNRRTRREENATVIDVSDLRHRLLKKRRVNVSRSGIGLDSRKIHRNDGPYFEDQRYRSHSRRSEPRKGHREASTGNRLQGRISLSRRLVGANNRDSNTERDIEMGRCWGRLSPGRSSNYNHRRPHDRLKRRSSEGFRSDEKNFGAAITKGEEERPFSFVGPKSLSELKSKKFSQTSEQTSMGGSAAILSREQKNMKLGKALGNQDTDSVPFDGPQPLSVILKRKREAATTNSTPSSEEIGSDKGVDNLPVASDISAGANINLQFLQSSGTPGKDNQMLDCEAASVDIEGDENQPYTEEYVQGVDEEGLDYNEEYNYEHGEEEYYEDEDAEYAVEGGDNMYEETQEGGENMYEET